MSKFNRGVANFIAVSFATVGSLVMAAVLDESGTTDAAILESVPAAQGELDGLIDAHAALELGGWWLDELAVDAKLGFDPQHDRLVWYVTGDTSRVVLDAESGEALAFDWV